MLDQSRAPYLEALQAHLAAGVSSFHVPGHQGGLGADPELRQLLGHALRADITEVMGIDDLHRPHGQLGEAQRLAAEAFGADQTHFLINGSTSGIHAMLLATSGPGDTLLVPRNAHRSVWGGLLLSGATAALYEPPFDRELGLYGPPTAKTVRQAAQQHPQAKAILLTNPTYHGHAADMPRVVQAAHRSNLLTLVDEAWGAHLAFHPDFPVCAMHAGADICVQSTHKLLPSLTQSAMLHVQGLRIDRGRLEQALRTLLSSSPSALLVASLDAARRQYVLHGHDILTKLATLATETARDLNRLEGISCRGGWSAGHDPTRLVVSALARGHTGYELEAYLRHEYRTQVEMADLFGVVLVLTAGHAEEPVRNIVAACQALPAKPRALPLAPAPPAFPREPLTPRETLAASTRSVPWTQAVELRSAETVTLYPPGIPWLLPGERIGKEILHELKARQRAGGSVQGASDPSLETVRVLD